MTMITIPTTAKAIAALRKTLGAPRGATHFRFTIEGRNPVINAMKNLDVLAGCSGTIEFGKMTGRGRASAFEPIVEQVQQPAQPPAEDAITTEADNEPTPGTETPQRGRRKGTRHTIAGHSACAVLKALGKASVKYAEADAILKAHGIAMPKASVNVQLGFGRNEATWARHGKPAELDAATLGHLRAQAAPTAAA